MSGQFNSASDYLRSLNEMANGDYSSFYRNLNGQIMFPEPGNIQADQDFDRRPEPPPKDV